jgi:hypothetical protein
MAGGVIITSLIPELTIYPASYRGWLGQANRKS